MQTESKEHVFEVGSPAELVVKNIRGKVTVRPGEDGMIKITETRYPDSGNPDYTEIQVGQNASGTVTASVSAGDSFFGFFQRRPLKIDFEIETPANTNLKVKMVSGAVEAHGLNGAVSLKTVSGSITAHNLNGAVTLKTVSGSITANDLNGDLHLDSVSGAIRGHGLSGPARATVVSGKIDLRGCDFPSLQAKAVSGKAAVETKLGEGPYQLKAVSGSLVMVVPEDTHCTVDASTVSGRFKTDLAVSQSTANQRSWHVQIGSGGAPVRMKTVSGKMHLLSAFDAVGETPGTVHMNSTQREEVLTRLSQGEIDVEQAIQELGG